LIEIDCNNCSTDAATDNIVKDKYIYTI
jgi:hypothetical protein